MSTTSEQAQPPSDAGIQRIREPSPHQRQVVGFVTLLMAGVLILVLGGLALTGTAIAAVVFIPVLIFFSPLLILLGVAFFFTTAGLLTTGGFGLAVLSAIMWIYNYCTGRHPPGSDQVDAARIRIHDTAEHLKERARDYSNNVQGYLSNSKQDPKDAAPGA